MVSGAQTIPLPGRLRVGASPVVPRDPSEATSQPGFPAVAALKITGAADFPGQVS